MLKAVFYTEGTLYWSCCYNEQDYVPQLLLHSPLWSVLLEIRWFEVKKMVSSQILCACKTSFFFKNYQTFILFIPCLFNNSLHNADDVAPNDGWLVNNKLKRMQKKQIIEKFNVISGKLHGGTKKMNIKHKSA